MSSKLKEIYKIFLRPIKSVTLKVEWTHKDVLEKASSSHAVVASSMQVQHMPSSSIDKSSSSAMDYTLEMKEPRPPNPMHSINLMEEDSQSRTDAVLANAHCVVSGVVPNHAS